MIVIINGAPGSGKTTTVKYLLESTPNSAAVDGDLLLGVNPQNRTDGERRLRYKNITDVAKNYHQSGYKTIFISFVYGQKQLNEQLDMLKEIDRVEVFALVPNEETLRKRHAQDTHARDGIGSSIELNKKIAAVKGSHIIDNSKMSIEEVARKIKKTVDL